MLDRDLDLHIACKRDMNARHRFVVRPAERLMPEGVGYRSWNRAVDGGLTVVEEHESDSGSDETSSSDGSDFEITSAGTFGNSRFL